MNSNFESISTWYFKRTSRKTPSGTQVSYSYKPPRTSESISDSYKPPHSSRSYGEKRPEISTYRRRKYTNKSYYHVWYV